MVLRDARHLIGIVAGERSADNSRKRIPPAACRWSGSLRRGRRAGDQSRLGSSGCRWGRQARTSGSSAVGSGWSARFVADVTPAVHRRRGLLAEDRAGEVSAEVAIAETAWNFAGIDRPDWQDRRIWRSPRRTATSCGTRRSSPARQRFADVVRLPRGFGELVFVGLDLDQPPLADWPSRNAFWHSLLKPYLSTAEQSNQPPRLSSLGYSDLSGALRQRLGVRVALGYYDRVSGGGGARDGVFAADRSARLSGGPQTLGRPMLGWVSFPLVVLLSCCGAIALGRWSKGTESHVNQAEIVDFDAESSGARGTYWSTMYDPHAERHDLRIGPRLPGGQAAESAESLLSWFGLAGTGLGGMHASGTGIDIVRTGYRFAPQLNALEGVPILSASTKSFMARWTAAARSPASAELKLDENGLLLGTVKNESAHGWSMFVCSAGNGATV